MAIQLTVKEGNSERSWDVVDGQQIDINMAKGAEYALIDTRTGETPDGLRVVNNHGQTEIYGSDTFPWVTLHDDGSDTDAAPQPEAAPVSPAARRRSTGRSVTAGSTGTRSRSNTMRRTFTSTSARARARTFGRSTPQRSSGLWKGT